MWTTLTSLGWLAILVVDLDTAAKCLKCNAFIHSALAALKAIQEFAVACTFAMPESPDPKKVVDPTQIHVFYKKDPADPGMEIPQVPNEGSCDPVTGGWYYDNPADPAAIHLCEASCAQANDINFPNGSIEVEAGCQIIAD